MQAVTKFLLDSGDINEYKEIAQLAKEQGSELWGATTNPTLIAKQLSGKKLTQKEAFNLQKDIVLQIIELLPGAVSAEVYADKTTTAEEMIEQGRDIASWHRRIIVKLPTTLEGLKARTQLRKVGIAVNNTLVFSQQQIFALCLHEQIIQQHFGPTNNVWPPFISPFVGRLDDRGEDGMNLVDYGMKIKREFTTTLPATSLAIWMLAASIRRIEHMKRSLSLYTEIITAPAKIYREWFALSQVQKEDMDEDKYAQKLTPLPLWIPPKELTTIQTENELYEAIEKGHLPFTHPLTEKGIEQFVADWNAILQ